MKATTTLLATAMHLAGVSAVATNGSLLLPILAGIHTIYSWPDTADPSPELLALTRAGLVGGVILFGENVNASLTPPGMLALQDAYEGSPAPGLIARLFGIEAAPLIIMTDQEGGRVKRIPEGGPATSAKVTGQQADPGAAGLEAGSSAAETLTKYNNNGNLAPVLDVFQEPGNFIDEFERSYGNTSALVTKAGIAFVLGSQANGVAAAAKHFPGLGTAPQGANTDLVPVTLDVSEDELRSVHIPPFQAAVDAGVDMIMPSWAIYPALDPELPAGMSPVFIKGELRQGLGFKGVTVTDAIEAGSAMAVGGGDAGRTAVMAAQAGMDLLLSSARNVTQGIVVRKALEEAVGSGELDRAEFDAATERIVKLRAKLAAAAAAAARS
jgi:beta-glucosidase-like glycosyl hydrolase